MLRLEEVKQCGFQTFDLLALRTAKPVGLIKQVPSVINFTHNLKPAYILNFCLLCKLLSQSFSQMKQPR